MARERKLGDLVYNYIIDHLKTIHELANAPTVVKQDLPCYKNISELIRGVLADPRFFDVDEYQNHKTPTNGQIEISKGTIRGAINRLIADKKISKADGYFEYIPPVDNEFNLPPILGIAQETQITINVPESYLVLSVSDGLAASVAEYLSAQFYRNDIIFIPIGNHIICISVFPKSIINNEDSNEVTIDSNPSKTLRDRITSVLHSFDCEYPSFVYGSKYEIAYTASRNPEVNAEIRKMAYDDNKKRFSYHRYVQLMKMFQSLPWFEEYRTLSSHFGMLECEHDGVDDEEWDIMDSQTMQEVDDDFKDY